MSWSLGAGLAASAIARSACAQGQTQVTAWATPDGVVQFRDDIYNRDGFGGQANAVKG